MPTPAHVPGGVTGEELIQHRLSQLEEWRVESAATVRSTERDVDALKIEGATVKGLLIELRTEVRDNDQHTRGSLARLHERLDSITTAESFEDGRQAGVADASQRTWKVIAWSVATTITAGLLVVGVLNLLLN